MHQHESAPAADRQLDLASGIAILVVKTQLFDRFVDHGAAEEFSGQRAHCVWISAANHECAIQRMRLIAAEFLEAETEVISIPGPSWAPELIHVLAQHRPDLDGISVVFGCPTTAAGSASHGAQFNLLMSALTGPQSIFLCVSDRPAAWGFQDDIYHLSSSANKLTEDAEIAFEILASTMSSKSLCGCDNHDVAQSMGSAQNAARAFRAAWSISDRKIILPDFLDFQGSATSIAALIKIKSPSLSIIKYFAEDICKIAPNPIFISLSSVMDWADWKPIGPDIHPVNLITRGK